MKQYALTLAFVVMLFSACKSPEHSAYVAVGSVGSAANAAIGAYSEYIKTHNVPESQVKEVRRAVEAYVQANDAAALAVKSFKAGQGSQQAVDILLDALAASSANVVALINTITQK